MKQDLTRRALLVGASVTAIGAAVCATASRGQPQQKVGGMSRYGLAIDTTCCPKDCTACIDVCHQAHAVRSPRDPRHAVKWVWKEPFGDVFAEQVPPFTPSEQRQMPTLVTCNHCGSPPCVRVCPTRATWKRADGIVAMDPHRCIGCRYCMAACPYGARSFNWEDPPKAQGTDYPQRSAGVVEKCTLCVERIDEGQVPLCVQACKQAGRRALHFGDLADPNSEIVHLLTTRRTMRRRPEFGTQPNVFYLV